MEANAPCGLLKFFQDVARLDELIDGRIYCNTPEFYRNHGAPGVGDRYESLSWAYRKGRGDPEPYLEIGDREIGDLERLDIRGTGLKDRWLHCWTALRFPGDVAALRQLGRDLERLRAEFGGAYAFVYADDVNPMLDRIQASTEHQVNCAEVTYSDDLVKQSPLCKGESYRYQREWRILIGECGDKSETELDFQVEGGLSDFILKNPPIRLFNNKNNETLLQMEGTGPFYCRAIAEEE